MSKLRHFVPLNTLTQMYYSIIYPFLTYGIVAWGNTYVSNMTPLITLQKRAIRVITFSNFQAHTTPLFKNLGILKLLDIVNLYTALLLHQFHNGILPNQFNDFFVLVRNHHHYNTRLASKTSFTLPTPRTNYGLFNVRFCGPKLWNTIDESLKHLPKSSFKIRSL